MQCHSVTGYTRTSHSCTKKKGQINIIKVPPSGKGGEVAVVNNRKGLIIAGLLILLILISIGVYLHFSTSKSQTATDFVKTRPSSSGVPPQSNIVYELKGPALNPTAEVSQLGITIWKLRSAAATDDKRLLFQDTDSMNPSQDSANKADTIPERVEANTTFKIGDKVLLTIESPRAGYLYVIDREQYADGTLSEPYLIYPNSKTLDNRLRAGQLFRVPSCAESPNYFWMKPHNSSSTQVGELLSIIVTTEQVQNLPVSDKPLPLAAETAARLEGAGNLKVERYEMKNGSGQPWTIQEKAASCENQRVLTQEDPLPQTIYRTPAGPNTPLVIKVSLLYKHN